MPYGPSHSGLSVHSHIFPRCYDLSDGKQIEQFVTDFNQTAIVSIIKVMGEYFSEKYDYISDLLEEYKKKDLFENPRNAFKKKFLRKCHDIDTERV